MAANAHPEIRIRKGGHWLTFPIQKRAVFPKIKPPARGATRRGGNQGIGWSPTDRAPHKQPRRSSRILRMDGACYPLARKEDCGKGPFLDGNPIIIEK